MSAKRRQLSPNFKAQVALHALKEDRTVSEISKEYSIAPSKIYEWKRIAREGLSTVFSKEKKIVTGLSSEEADKLYAELRSKEMESEFKIVEAKSASANYQASIFHDSSMTGTSYWVQNVRALVRPTVTALLWVLVAVIWFTSLSNESIRQDIVATVLYVATTATTWWFGSRDGRKML